MGILAERRKAQEAAAKPESLLDKFAKAGQQTEFKSYIPAIPKIPAAEISGPVSSGRLFTEGLKTVGNVGIGAVNLVTGLGNVGINAAQEATGFKPSGTVGGALAGGVASGIKSGIGAAKDIASAGEGKGIVKGSVAVASEALDKARKAITENPLEIAMAKPSVAKAVGQAGLEAAGTAAKAVGSKFRRAPAEVIANEAVSSLRKGVNPQQRGRKPLTKEAVARENETYKRAGDALARHIEETGVEAPRTVQDTIDLLDEAKAATATRYSVKDVPVETQAAGRTLEAMKARLPEMKKHGIGREWQSVINDLEEVGGTQTLEQAERFLANVNSRMKGAIQSGNYVGKNALEAVREGFRRELVNDVNKLGGEQYAALRRDWGALNELQDKLAQKARLQAGRKPVGVMDNLADLATVGAVFDAFATSGAFTAKAAAFQGAKMLTRYLNSPDRGVRNFIAKMQKARARGYGDKIAEESVGESIRKSGALEPSPVPVPETPAATVFEPAPRSVLGQQAGKGVIENVGMENRNVLAGGKGVLVNEPAPSKPMGIAGLLPAPKASRAVQAVVEEARRAAGNRYLSADPFQESANSARMAVSQGRLSPSEAVKVIDETLAAQIDAAPTPSAADFAYRRAQSAKEMLYAEAGLGLRGPAIPKPIAETAQASQGTSQLSGIFGELTPNPGKTQLETMFDNLGGEKMPWDDVGENVPSTVAKEAEAPVLAKAKGKEINPILTEYEGQIKNVRPQNQVKFNQGTYAPVRLVLSEEDKLISQWGSANKRRDFDTAKSIQEKLGLNRSEIYSRSQELKDIAKRFRKMDSETVVDLTKGEPVIIDEKGQVLDGNHRMTAYEAAGVKEIPVYRPKNKKFRPDNERTREQVLFDRDVKPEFYQNQFRAPVLAKTTGKETKLQSAKESGSFSESKNMQEPPIYSKLSSRDAIAKQLKRDGFEVSTASSNSPGSKSEYITVSNDAGDTFKIRISNHDLPAKYGGIRGGSFADFEIGKYASLEANVHKNAKGLYEAVVEKLGKPTPPVRGVVKKNIKGSYESTIQKIKESGLSPWQLSRNPSFQLSADTLRVHGFESLPVSEGVAKAAISRIGFGEAIDSGNGKWYVRIKPNK